MEFRIYELSWCISRKHLSSLLKKKLYESRIKLENFHRIYSSSKLDTARVSTFFIS